jgi:hypothetical protein
LLGWGIGAFQVHDDFLKDPHNLPAELLMETGLIGLMLFAVPAIFAALAGLQMLRDPRSGWADMAIALMALTSLLSELTVEGSIGEDRILFCVMGLVIGYQAARGRSAHQAGGAVPRLAYRRGAVPDGLR